MNIAWFWGSVDQETEIEQVKCVELRLQDPSVSVGWAYLQIMIYQLLDKTFPAVDNIEISIICWQCRMSPYYNVEETAPRVV